MTISYDLDSGPVYEFGHGIEPKLVAGRHHTYTQEFQGTYTMFLGDRMSRQFTAQTLPESLKITLSMIHAHNWEAIHAGMVYSPLSFPVTFPHDMYDIGWKTSRFEYCIVLNKQQLNNLRGISVQNCTLKVDDSRGQDQSAGEESS